MGETSVAMSSPERTFTEKQERYLLRCCLLYNTQKIFIENIGEASVAISSPIGETFKKLERHLLPCHLHAKKKWMQLTHTMSILNQEVGMTDWLMGSLKSQETL